MAQVRIDDDIYSKLKEAAEFNKRTVGQHIAFLLDNEITFNEIRGMLAGRAPAEPVAQAEPMVTVSLSPEEMDMYKEMKTGRATSRVKKPNFKSPNFPNGIDWAAVEREVMNPENREKYAEQLKKAKEREANRKLSLDDLTEEDLATAKVTFEERPDFKEPEKWDRHAWPTV